MSKIPDFRVAISAIDSSTWESALAKKIVKSGNTITRRQVEEFQEANRLPPAQVSDLLFDINANQRQQEDNIRVRIRNAGEGFDAPTRVLGLEGPLTLALNAVATAFRSLLPGGISGRDNDRLLKLIERGDIEGVKSFKSENGVDRLAQVVNRLGPDLQSPVVMAAFQGKTEILKVLLQAGGRITALDPIFLGTALHAAAFAGHAEAAEVLLQAGIDIDAVGPYNGRTALHDAAKSGKADVARLLLKYGADTSIRANNGETALAVARRFKNDDVVAVLTA